MKHYGDITKIDVNEVPIVDIITGGSPCQDLSVAGKRAGLDGERSGLFMEQIRIVKEMRARDVRENGRSGKLIRPRYMVWENVPGALSSPGKDHTGEDFQAVLTEIVKIAEAEAPDVPLPNKGKWPNAGFIYDEMGNWSIAWRVHDAQFWGMSVIDNEGRVVKRGTPQRRRRIALVADFGGLSAPKVLFESPCLPRHPEESGEAREGTPGGSENGSDSAICLQGNGIDRADTAGCNGRGWRRGGAYTLNTIDRPAVYDEDPSRVRGGG